MKISPAIHNNYNVKKAAMSPNFGSIFADASEKTQDAYAFYTYMSPNFSTMKCSSTRIFRDLPSEIAIAKMLNPKQKSQVKILGCADGSEAWGYAIVMKEIMGKNAKNVSIQAIDKAPYMIKAAKTGHLVLSDVEHKYAEGKTAIFKEKSPIAGSGWNKHFKKTKRPEGFDKILANYPFMKYLENDPVVGKKIGSGFDWYEVNKEGLPEVTFECKDMRDCLTPDNEADNVVYVMANSAGYVFEKNPNDFLKLFASIKENNKGKNTYVAIGSIETRILNSYATLINGYEIPLKNIINGMGFKNVSEEELLKLGISSTSIHDTSRKLYKLEA